MGLRLKGDNLDFEKEVKIIKRHLGLDSKVQVLHGTQAQCKICRSEDVYQAEYALSIIKEYKGVYGFYLWWENENTVLVKEKTDFINLAHELRHAWQWKNRKDKKFRFKKPGKSKIMRFLYKILVYPVTKTELDANKYAYYFAKSRKLSKGRPLKAIITCYLLRFVYLCLFIFISALLFLFV